MKNFLVIALLFVGCSQPESAIEFDSSHQQFQAVVVRVIDGDTFVLNTGTHVRLKKIDALKKINAGSMNQQLG